MGTVVRCPDESGSYIARVARTLIVQYAHRHDARIRCHAGDADVVVGRSCDGSCHVRSVTVSIPAVVSVIDHIDAGNEGALQILMRGHTCVDDGHRCAFTAGEVPRGFGLHSV